MDTVPVGLNKRRNGMCWTKSKKLTLGRDETRVSTIDGDVSDSIKIGATTGSINY